MALFNPSMKPSTFHDWVKRGKFVACKDVRGYYALNQTRQKLGMPLVDIAEYRQKLAGEEASERSQELFHAGLAVTVPEAIDAKLPIKLPAAMTREESEQVLALYKALYKHLQDLKLFSEDARIGFVAGALLDRNLL